MATNNQPKAIASVVAAAAVALGSIFLTPDEFESSALVAYQIQCAKLQDLHGAYIAVADPRMAFTDGEARRSSVQAIENAKRGIGIANSLHIKGLARDKFLTINGRVTFDPKDYLTAGELWEQLGLKFGVATAWGGRFKSVDAVHFSCAYQGVK